jgi:hypothetical protein
LSRCCGESAPERIDRLRASLTYLIHGHVDFAPRLHDVLYDARLSLGLFGFFCAPELAGAVQPEDCPPMNGRMAKALHYLGFEVKAA